MSGLRVLFADDEPNILAALRRALHTARPDWEPLFATTTADALTQLPVDVLVCDPATPPLTGLLDAPGAHALLALSARTDRDTLLATLARAHRYLPKPCPLDDLLDAVTQVTTALRRAGTLPGFATHSLPKPPTVYTDLVTTAAHPGCTAADLAAVVRRDLATTADVLKLVNSGLFCPPSHVESVEEAVVLLGVDTLQALALASGAYRSSGPLPPGFDLEALAARATRTAAATRRLATAEHLGRTASSALFLAAVLADIGLLAQVTARPTGWATVRDTDPPDRPAAEIAAFGCTSAQAAAYLIALWGFPDAVLEPLLDATCPTGLLLATARSED